MGKFSRKINRNPDAGFVGKKQQTKQIHKMIVKAQRDYWKQLKTGVMKEAEDNGE